MTFSFSIKMRQKLCFVLFILPTIFKIMVVGQLPEEYKEPLQMLEKFMHSVVNPLDETICREINGMKKEVKGLRDELCSFVYYVQNDYKFMVGELSEEPSRHVVVGLTFYHVKHHLTPWEVESKLATKLAKENWVSEEFCQAFRKEVEKFWHKGLHTLEHQFKSKVDELKMLQFHGDFSSKHTKQLAYECVYLGRRMADVFNGNNKPIGEFHWALRQFPVDLLVYKIAIPELRDIRIEWEQDGIASALVPEGYEEAKALLDYFTEMLLNPIMANCQKIHRREKAMQEMLCNTSQLLSDYPIKKLNNELAILLMMKEQKNLAKLEVHWEKVWEGKGKQIKLENNETENIDKFKRIALLTKAFQGIKDIVFKGVERLIVALPAKFQCLDENGSGHEEVGKKHFKESLAKLNSIHSNGDFASKEMQQLAFECIDLCNKMKKFYQSPVGLLNWALQQFTVNLMAYSMKVPWARELPVQSMNAMIEQTTRFNSDLVN